MNRQFAGYGLLLALMLVAPAVVYPVLVMKILCFALFACAFNLLIGFTGLLSFGHAVFLGTAGYVAGHSIKVWGFPPELGLIAAALAGAALGWVIGSLAIRRSGISFAMITLALAQMMYFFFLQAPFTGGEDGLQEVPRGKLLGFIDLADDYNLYYFVLAIFVFAFWLVHRTIHLPFRQVLKATRENEARAISLGYDVAKYKLLAFVLSAGLAGLAGATKTLYHPVGTCRMGEDRDAVVDSKLRVRGIDHLRVIDGSLMPTVISGNTNLPIMAMAEKAAELIAGK